MLEGDSKCTSPRIRPATFGYAGYSLLADFKMLGHALRGRMSDEMKRSALLKPDRG